MKPRRHKDTEKNLKCRFLRVFVSWWFTPSSSALRLSAISAVPWACLLVLVGFVSKTPADTPAPLVRLTTDGHLKQRPAWSPDGKWLVFTRHQGATIFLFMLSDDGKTERRLTASKDPEFDAVFAPSGKRIAFSFDKASPNQGDIDVYTCLPDGTDLKAVAATEGKLSHEEWPAWSPDSEWLAYSSTRDDNQEIYVAKGDGSEKKRLTTDLALDAHPAWSTDGKRLAFTSNRDGNLEIYTMDPDGQNPRNETQNPASDNFPSWTRDGRLTFVSNREEGFDIYVSVAAKDANAAKP